MWIIGSRIPFVPLGYGSDPDAWRVAAAAKELWDTGTYHVSRFPGYPLHEFISAPLIAAGGSIATNAATLFVSLLAVYVFWRISTEHGARHPDILVLGFAFFPLIWKNTGATMDYVWSLLFILAALRSALRNRALWAGVFVGIGCGFRPSNAITLVPLAVLLILSNKSWKSLVPLLLGAGTTTALSFVPVFCVYGFSSWLAFTRSQIEEAAIHQHITALHSLYRSLYAIGPLAVIAAAMIVLRHRRVILNSFRSWEPLIVASTAGILIPLLVFFRIPLEREYLLVAIPFFLLLLDRFAARREMIIFVLTVVSFGFLNPDVIHHRGLTGVPGFNIHTGMVVEEWEKRQNLYDQLRTIPSFKVPPRSIVMTGLFHLFWIENPAVARDTSALAGQFHEPLLRNTSRDSLYYVLLLTTEEIRRSRRLGYRVMCTAQAKAYIEQAGRYTLEEQGVEVVAKESTFE